MERLSRLSHLVGHRRRGPIRTVAARDRAALFAQAIEAAINSRECAAARGRESASHESVAESNAEMILLRDALEAEYLYKQELQAEVERMPAFLRKQAE